jgi:cytoskeletal protein RodZ
MASFGDDLRKEREQRKVSLDEIAQHTKVSVRNLRALESNRFDLLPGGVFNRGILRNYLQYLDLDEHDWVERFTQTPGSGGVHAGDGGEWLTYAQTVSGVRPSPAGEDAIRFRWLGVLLLFLLLAIGGWFTYRFAAAHWHHAASVDGAAGATQDALLYCDHAADQADDRAID